MRFEENEIRFQADCIHDPSNNTHELQQFYGQSGINLVGTICPLKERCS